MRKTIWLLSAFLLIPLGCGPPDTKGCVKIKVLYIADLITEPPTTQPSTQPTQPSSKPTTNQTISETIIPGQIEYNSGSGIVLGKSGKKWYALTALHVIHKNYIGIFVDGQSAQVVGRLIESDLVVLSFESKKKYPRREFAIAKQGQTAWLVGYPSTYDGKPFVCRVNICLEVNQHIVWNGGTAPGMSGAPLLDDWGRVLGISTSSILIRDTIFDSFGIGISSRFIKKIFGE